MIDISYLNQLLSMMIGKNRQLQITVYRFYQQIHSGSFHASKY